MFFECFQDAGGTGEQRSRSKAALLRVKDGEDHEEKETTVSLSICGPQSQIQTTLKIKTIPKISKMS